MKTSKIDEKELAVVSTGAARVCEVLQDCNDVDIVFKILATATAVSLCALTSSGEDASRLFSVFQEAVDDAVNNAADVGATNWSGKGH
jgi:hypothetical protein